MSLNGDLTHLKNRLHEESAIIHPYSSEAYRAVKARDGMIENSVYQKFRNGFLVGQKFFSDKALQKYVHGMLIAGLTGTIIVLMDHFFGGGTSAMPYYVKTLAIELAGAVGAVDAAGVAYELRLRSRLQSHEKKWKSIFPDL